MRRKHTYVIRSLAEYETAIANHLDQAEIDRLHSLAISYQAELFPSAIKLNLDFMKSVTDF